VSAGIIRAYAGVPLELPSGHVLGSHCVMSVTPRAFTEADVATLRAAGEDVIAAICRYELSTSTS
jgi:GAF domain-containing protein